MFDRYQRRRAELDRGIGEMFVKGVSTLAVGQVAVGQVIEALTDIKPSPSTVSRVFHTLDGEYITWKQPPPDAHYVYAFAFYAVIRGLKFRRISMPAEQPGSELLHRI